ncbi:MAG: hypothetical protein D6687_03925 [Acidobacteria bacterium]|jgi:signal transduction histidine kinase|nr:MAG: hypothetical protein D6687_03925 [Acidobacteriota bacterium]GIU80940.1 MAG: hypothetical protein KatS3mg006_0004 [Pyrinomonadaceae bacterium]
MKRLKNFLYETRLIWAYIIFAGFFFGVPLLLEPKSEELQAKEFYIRIFAVFFLSVPTFLVFHRLRYWDFWALVLTALAIFGTGIAPPDRILLYPDKYSILGALLTFVAVLMFLLLEKIEAKYIIRLDSSEIDPFLDANEIITLNLNDNVETLDEVKKITNKETIETCQFVYSVNSCSQDIQSLGKR